ncbi:zinc finger protein 250-like [Micropterus salmoides]|uniref:zinc finger protein 250-like n=1 Tax=Micropterus salmoides TaxID=27706 RepID=UPI0018EB9DD8|nr:zinc finger protein 250-like [Micropterus salmoides]
MLQLDLLRLFVDQQLAAVTDDIFRRFAKTIAEYESEVFRLKQESDRQRRLLQAAGLPGHGPEDGPGHGPEDGPEDGPGHGPAGVFQVFSTDEQQVRGRGLHLHLNQEEGGALGPEETFTKSIQSHEWLRESPSSNRILSCREEAGPEPTVYKKEMDEGHMMLEAAVRAEISSQQEGVLQVLTTEEEQGGGQSVRLHVKEEEEETDTKFTQSPDWLMKSDHVLFHRGEDLLAAPPDSHLIRPKPGETSEPADHSRDSVVQSESSTEDSDDTQSDPGLQRTQGTGTRPPADQNLLVCGSCGREFSSKRTLRKHIRQNMSQDQDQMSCSLRRPRAPFQNPAKSFSCRVCGSSFYTQGILVRHAEIHCKEPDSRCGACGDQLESTEALRVHLRSHRELGSTCDVCGKKSSSIKRMEIHKRVHTGEKPYRCRFCSRDFSRKESLERHMKVHTGDRPHCCGLCRKTFTRREYLVHHLKTGHTERPGPPAGAEPFNVAL